MYDNSHFLLIKPAVFADFPTRTHHRKTLNHGLFYFHNLTPKQTTRGSRTLSTHPCFTQNIEDTQTFFFASFDFPYRPYAFQ